MDDRVSLCKAPILEGLYFFQQKIFCMPNSGVTHDFKKYNKRKEQKHHTYHIFSLLRILPNCAKEAEGDDHDDDLNKAKRKTQASHDGSCPLKKDTQVFTASVYKDIVGPGTAAGLRYSHVSDLVVVLGDGAATFQMNLHEIHESSGLGIIDDCVQFLFYAYSEVLLQLVSIGYLPDQAGNSAFHDQQHEHGDEVREEHAGAVDGSGAATHEAKDKQQEAHGHDHVAGIVIVRQWQVVLIHPEVRVGPDPYADRENPEA